jgi:hypothetical protein
MSVIIPDQNVNQNINGLSSCLFFKMLMTATRTVIYIVTVTMKAIFNKVITLKDAVCSNASI